MTKYMMSKKKQKPKKQKKPVAAYIATRKGRLVAAYMATPLSSHERDAIGGQR